MRTIVQTPHRSVRLKPASGLGPTTKRGDVRLAVTASVATQWSAALTVTRFLEAPIRTYHIGEQIGRGGMADVYLALQKGSGSFERLVVVKRINDWAARSEDSLKSFQLEAKVSATMSHAHIVRALDFGEDDDGPYLVLEYLSGETLSFVLRKLRQANARLPIGIVCRIAASMASALDFIQQLQLADGSSLAIVHRDVNPSNVMCCYNGQVKLLDFGVAKVRDSEPTQAGVIKGKPSYLAPEQINGQPLDQRTDIYQLGVVMWEMLTGQRLFPDGPSAVAKIFQGGIEAPRRVEPSIPRELDDLVVWALRYEKAERCPSPKAFLDALMSAAPDAFGTNQEQRLQLFMTSTFAEHHAERREQERRTYALAKGMDLLDNHPGASNAVTQAPVFIRSAIPQPRRRPGLSSLLLLLLILAVIVVAAGLLVPAGPPGARSDSEEAPVRTAPAELEDPVPTLVEEAPPREEPTAEPAPPAEEPEQVEPSAPSPQPTVVAPEPSAKQEGTASPEQGEKEAPTEPEDKSKEIEVISDILNPWETP
ncbi:MAG: serine/threonine-protein kinase [Myxococcota bacterium]